MKTQAFWTGFVKRAAASLGDPSAPVPAEAAELGAAPNEQQAPEKLLKWNPQGGCDPRSPEEMATAQGVDLITLPEGTEGASCGNCQFFRLLDPGLGTGFCTNPVVKLDVTSAMHCSQWNAPETYRAWEQEDPSAVPDASMMQEAGQLSGEMAAQGGGMGLPPGMMPPGAEMNAPGAVPGSAGEGAPSPSGAPPTEGGAGGEGGGEAAGGPPAKKPEKKDDKKDSGGAGGHTINVHVNNGGKDEKDDKKTEKKAFWAGFES